METCEKCGLEVDSVEDHALICGEGPITTTEDTGDDDA